MEVSQSPFTTAEEDYNTATLGEEKEAVLPEGMELLNSLPTYPKTGNYHVQTLSAGIKMGRGWEDLGDRFYYDLMARIEAFRICKATGQTARVILLSSSERIITCFFYKKDKRVCIAYPVVEVEGKKKIRKMVEQEILSELDETGGKAELKEVPDE